MDETLWKKSQHILFELDNTQTGIFFVMEPSINKEPTL